MANRSQELHGRSVLVATVDQFIAALALLELDGIASRLVLCPPDLPPEHLGFVIGAAGVDAIVSDRGLPESAAPRIDNFICRPEITPAAAAHRVSHETEWILLTSGTTGMPKLVAHTLKSLSGAIDSAAQAEEPVVWGTFYDLRRYGGLQIFLRAVVTAASLVLSGPNETTDDYLARAAKCGLTHISGTPSHWRSALMCRSAGGIDPQYIRLSGEIVDQAILDRLASFYPGARIAHAFASTEAGVAFDVNDGLAGFPVTLLNRPDAGVEMKVLDGTLRIRSSRLASRYTGQDATVLRDAEGFVDTGDVVENRAGRCYFAGRRDGTINVGGLKVHPEEVEAVINRHHFVQMVLVRPRKNPVTGSVVVADVVLADVVPPESASAQRAVLRDEILRCCRNVLPRHKVPAAINFVGTLPVAATGKMVRHYA